MRLSMLLHCLIDNEQHDQERLERKQRFYIPLFNYWKKKTDSHLHGPASEDSAGGILLIMGLWKYVCHCTPPNLPYMNPYSNS
jgi:hypothetical protein